MQKDIEKRRMAIVTFIITLAVAAIGCKYIDDRNLSSTLQADLLTGQAETAVPLTATYQYQTESLATMARIATNMFAGTPFPEAAFTPAP